MRHTTYWFAKLRRGSARAGRDQTRRVRGSTWASGALVVGLALVAPMALASPAQARVVSLSGFGADACAAPTAASMQAWWTGTRFSFFGIYIGGIDRSCAQPNLTAAWVTAVSNQGWFLEPIWVGLQSPCANQTNAGARFSTNTTTAYSQGRAEGFAAYTALANLGFDPGLNGNTPVALDLEGFALTSTCIAAAQSFVKGWDSALAPAPTQVSGVYGSTSASDFTALTGAPVPAFIWGALWDNNSNTSVLTPVPSTLWVNNQRLKQYLGQHVESPGNVPLKIDSDSANGPVYHR